MDREQWSGPQHKPQTAASGKFAPFNQFGGIGRAYELFGEEPNAGLAA